MCRTLRGEGERLCHCQGGARCNMAQKQAEKPKKRSKTRRAENGAPRATRATAAAVAQMAQRGRAW